MSSVRPKVHVQPDGGDEGPHKTIQFKVDLLFKVLILGGLGLAGKLSWSAWEGSQAQLQYQQQQIIVQQQQLNKLTMIVEVFELRFDRNEKSIEHQHQQLDEVYRNALISGRKEDR